MASNLNCYSGKVTNDKNNELRVTVLGQSKAVTTLTGTITIVTGTVTGVGTSFTTECAVGDIVSVGANNYVVKAISTGTSMTVTDAAAAAIAGSTMTKKQRITAFSTIIPLRDVLPAMPRELLMGRKKDKNNIFVSNGAFLGQTLGNVTINEKTASITVADDLIFDLGEPLGAPTKSILKNMLTGEIFKEYATDVDGVKPLGILGSAMYTGGSCPTMSLGNDWKYLFSKEAELKIPYGEGATKPNSFLETASSSQIPIVVEYKTTYGDGTVKVVRYTGVCGGNIMDNSADDLNKFSIDLDFFCDGKEYTGYFIDGGYTADADSATSVYKYKVNHVIEYVAGSAPTPAPTGAVDGDLAITVNSNTGAVKLWKRASGTFAALTSPTFKTGTVIFGSKYGTVETTTASKNCYVALKSGGAGVGTAINSTITVQSSTVFTLGASAVINIKDFDFTTQMFLSYIS